MKRIQPFQRNHKNSGPAPRMNFGMGDGSGTLELRDEREWVARAVRHDSEAFGWLYERTVNKIYKYIYYRVGTAAQAEDLTAQVYLKAWGAIQNYHWNARPFAAWLFRIAHNLIVDYFRTHHDAISIENLPLADESVDDAEDIVENHLTSEMLHHALRHLTPDQQQVIVLKFLEGYSTDELAVIMDRDPGAVRALQHRGLVALHRILEKSHALA